MKLLSAYLTVLLFSLNLFAQHNHGHSHAHDITINFPDIPGYQTISCDFHMHTVFSDGSVWPNIRVEEANREGIDCISTTEHLEYQPHSADIPHPDRNRAFEIASQRARGTDLLVINGSEITRSMPPGHTNAVFVTDANELLHEDAMDAFEAAKRQGAFIFTNHPMWTAQRKDGIAKYDPMHIELIENDMLHGIEVVNETTYSVEAVELALEHDLTFIGTSDIHGLVDWQYDIPHGGHRPVTLVFSEERSAEGIKEALFEKQTVVWYNDLFIGREEWLNPILHSSLKFEVHGYGGDTSLLEVEIHNPTHSKFIMKSESEFTFQNNEHIFVIEPKSSYSLEIKTLERLTELTLPFSILNAIYAPEMYPVIEWNLTINN